MKHEPTDDDRPFSVEEMRERVERLKREGRMPTLQEFLRVANKVVDRVVAERRERDQLPLGSEKVQ